MHQRGGSVRVFATGGKQPFVHLIAPLVPAFARVAGEENTPYLITEKTGPPDHRDGDDGACTALVERYGCRCGRSYIQRVFLVRHGPLDLW